jgi:hypothetical protein
MDRRASWKTLHRQIVAVKSNTFAQDLDLEGSQNLLILNTHRQIIYINQNCLGLVGLDDPSKVYGCRVGEILLCSNSDQHGCGTSKMCRYCGAAYTIRSGLNGSNHARYFCITEKNTKNKLTLRVKGNPIHLNEELYVLLNVTTRKQLTT